MRIVTFLSIALVVCCVFYCEAKTRQRVDHGLSSATIKLASGDESSGRRKLRKDRQKGKRTDSNAEGLHDGGRRKKLSSPPSVSKPLKIAGKRNDWGFVFSWHQNKMKGLDSSDYRSSISYSFRINL